MRAGNITPYMCNDMRTGVGVKLGIRCGDSPNSLMLLIVTPRPYREMEAMQRIKRRPQRMLHLSVKLR
jgi:hypothetical protein